MLFENLQRRCRNVGRDLKTLEKHLLQKEYLGEIWTEETNLRPRETPATGFWFFFFSYFGKSIRERQRHYDLTLNAKLDGIYQSKYCRLSLTFWYLQLFDLWVFHSVNWQHLTFFSLNNQKTCDHLLRSSDELKVFVNSLMSYGLKLAHTHKAVCQFCRRRRRRNDTHN